MKNSNNQYYMPIPKVLENLRGLLSTRVEKSLTHLNSEKKIDSAVEKYASIYFQTDKDFEGETLDKYKEYMKYSLYKYVVLCLDINSQEFGDLSYPEKTGYIQYIAEKYNDMFVQFVIDSV